ncbi:MAG: DNA alkylation repair protein [Blautia sp.]|jgi:3-methyladenine DNA glycosylase AlkD
MEEQKNPIRLRLEELVDEKYREFHSSLVPGEEHILGVRVPKLRALAKELAKGDWRSYLETATEETYEEIMLQGFVIGYAKMDSQEAYGRVAGFVPKIHNWAVCDCVCSTLNFAGKDLERTWEFLQPYLKDDREYYIRFGVIMLLDYFKKSPEYLSRVLEVLDGIHHDGYYVKMAVAWALSMYYIAYPKEVMEYFSHHHLDDFTYQKALQKIIESRQITEETRAQIREMKRRK